jgi:uncharacterized delta-60 repeat protein
MPRNKTMTATTLVFLVTGLIVAAAAPAQAAPGDLDPLFSGDGKVTTSFGQEELGSGVALQPDGKIVTVGTSFYTVCDDIWCSSLAQFALDRYNADGTLDVSFANGGIETTDFGGFDNGASAVALQPDGKIVVAGSGPTGFAVARYNPDGSLDPSFDGDGKLTTDFGVSAHDVAVQSDGKIVVVGNAGAYGGDFGLARYNPDGSLDASFSGGQVTTDLGGWEFDPSVALQADGRIIVAGSTDIGGGNFALARYNPDGSLDPSFWGDGEETTGFGVRHDGKAVAIQADGKIVVAGSTDSNDGDFAVARFNPDGTLDPSFSGDGEQSTNLGGRDYGHAVAIQGDGKIVVAGESANDFAVARYTVDGALDASFSGDGTQTTDFGTRADNSLVSLDSAADVVLQPDGNLVVAGSSDYDFALVRYQGGSLSRIAPINSTPPTISGTAADGQTLTAKPGAWTGSAPMNLSYQWRRCDQAGASCLDIVEATATAYILAAADVGHTIRVDETATNPYGTGSVDSAPTATVKPKPGAIGGKVTNTNHQPIAGATVSCGTAGTVTTNPIGGYLITGVPPLTSYNCTATAIGYAARTQAVTISPGNTTTANFSLVRVSTRVLMGALAKEAS